MVGSSETQEAALALLGGGLLAVVITLVLGILRGPVLLLWPPG
jgi:hypothetical protein